ncbi:anti-sigma factor [Mycolicibacterium wolinskyi]|uniref:Anti-sigma-K factor RskA n=1 Tax=Mycolicibacterium wolinskyi TaxID=59750 RepID=A0A1X2FE11_9MYCO|nr:MULTISPECIES: anti-sigma factor [Mycolicibacterium]MCV7284602.1 anti-sigma factor [Mycolicibacterium wolinskyi]MCV7291987.1 anti-sigma factor [Mycolicibacterium goodii]ORX16676.1 anti-sigma factor [Mycolicibacterium wolinskyi]
MTSPGDPELLTLATPYALHAVPESELADIERRVASAPPEVAEQFAAEVRAVRETMARVAASTAVEPPTDLRDRVLAAVAPGNVRELRPSRPRWRTALLAAAAAVVIALAGIGVGIVMRPAATPSTAEQVFAAPDVRTVSGPIPTGGTATVVFSRDRNAGVLVMNGVTPPETGTVYQMWLMRDTGPESAGTMDSAAVAPSTTAVLSDLGDASALAFTVEPGTGSSTPTTPIFARLPLR